jgi:hypothetical protein
VAIADLEQHGLDVERLNCLAVLFAHAEALAIQLHCGVEVLNRHADVIDPPEHGGGVY